MVIFETYMVLPIDIIVVITFKKCLQRNHKCSQRGLKHRKRDISNSDFLCHDILCRDFLSHVSRHYFVCRDIL